ncbi:NmrA-like domain-containing protein OS=Kitasatospora aureofaciens OX=1894 GN=GCM10010502_25970 PE=4 SV=1 [Kitasatospora aureofaciens]|uniref:Uncharacterized protein n=1 Tax=Kitasatospora aureofaciens TaxID=1894 RepID=A0A8H9LPE9_KITAU|nr:hypothetical protein GCM10010502_25970 [Kitasatospora aureofaciens]
MPPAPRAVPFGTDLATEVRQGTALLDAAAATGVGHVVFTSATNADRSTAALYAESEDGP